MNFDQAIERVLRNEGGYTTGVGDPGGETNWGISKRSYPHLDIKALTRDAAKAFYRSDFWGPVHAEAWPDALQFQALDFAVNSGIGTAIRKLQLALGVADDGYWGPITQAAANRMPPAQLALLLLAERLDFVRRLSNWQSAGAGWAGRIAADMRYAAEDLRQAPLSSRTTSAPASVPTTPGFNKAPIYTGADRRVP